MSVPTISNDERALIQKILSAPLDIFNWTVWADWVQDNRCEVEATEIRINADPDNKQWRLNYADLLEKNAIEMEPPKGYESRQLRKVWHNVEELRIETNKARAKLIRLQLELEEIQKFIHKQQRISKRLKYHEKAISEVLWEVTDLKVEGGYAKWEEKNPRWNELFQEQNKLLSDYGDHFRMGPVCMKCKGHGFINHKTCEDCYATGDLGGLSCYQQTREVVQVAQEVGYHRGSIRVDDLLTSFVQDKVPHTLIDETRPRRQRRRTNQIEPTGWALNIISNHVGVKLYPIDREPDLYSQGNSTYYQWISWSDNLRDRYRFERVIPLSIFKLLTKGRIEPINMHFDGYEDDTYVRCYESFYDAVEDLIHATTLYVRLHILSLMI